MYGPRVCTAVLAKGAKVNSYNMYGARVPKLPQMYGSSVPKFPHMYGPRVPNLPQMYGSSVPKFPQMYGPRVPNFPTNVWGPVMGTLIVPAWRSAPFWLMLCTDGVHFAGFVRRWTKFKYHDYLFRDGRSGNNIGSAMNTDTDILAIFIDFASKPRLFKAGFCTFDSCSACSLSWSAAT